MRFRPLVCNSLPFEDLSTILKVGSKFNQMFNGMFVNKKMRLLDLKKSVFMERLGAREGGTFKRWNPRGDESIIRKL